MASGELELNTRGRNKGMGQIAAFLDTRTVIISRGAREGVKVNDTYVILNGDIYGDRVAPLIVTQVEEKMAFAKSIWSLPRVPSLYIGWHVFLI